ncbi:MAG: glycosyltransferase family 4 protein [Hoeflea sp.]|uniref:glycosyltransferase family 4 protein n=1 Tax=Hoeflea sp. TaxID=1940281 RepID=UPI003EF707C8
MRKLVRNFLPKAVKSLILPPRLEVSEKTCGSVFDASYYLATNPDVEAAGVDPLFHFRRHGLSEGRKPNAWLSESYIRGHLHQKTLTKTSAMQAYVNSDTHQKPRLVFVSHDASRTGAPAIILRLLEMFSKSDAFECFTILDEGGERLAEFQELSHTHVMSGSRYDPKFSEQAAHQELSDLFHPNGVFESNPPVCALINSAESIRIGRGLSTLGIPVISLIHEVAAYYLPAVFEEFARISRKVIFPSYFVKNIAERFSDLDVSKVTVRGQGVLEEDFGSLSRLECRRLLRENLDIEEDAFVVLNVGTRDIRKGVDLFVDFAAMYLRGKAQPRPVYFVWYGAADKNFLYARDFIERHNLGEFVRLMPSTSEIEQVFLGGDIFFLTARADPFPCVVHEAMACGLPVIAFRQGGGAPELIGEDCGAIIDMADLKTGCEVLERYLTDSELYDHHSRSAIDKITQHWGFPDYHSDIYALIRQSVPVPKGGWPEVAKPAAPSHLVIMRGTVEELDLLRSEGGAAEDDVSHIALIDGRFGAEIDTVTDQLRREGRSFRVCQPVTDSETARADVVRKLTRKPRPQKVTLINTLHYLTPSLLKQLPYPKRAIVTEISGSGSDLYMMLPYLDSLALADRMMANRLVEMNPGILPRLSVLD